MIWRLLVDRDDRDGIAVFVVAGRLGTLGSGRLVEQLDAAVSAGHRRIVLDLADVDYVSSAGLLALQASAGRLSRAGGALVFCAITPPVRIALDLSGLLSDCPEQSSREVAVAHLRGPGVVVGRDAAEPTRPARETTDDRVN